MCREVVTKVVICQHIKRIGEMIFQRESGIYCWTLFYVERRLNEDK